MIGTHGPVRIGHLSLGDVTSAAGSQGLDVDAEARRALHERASDLVVQLLGELDFKNASVDQGLQLFHRRTEQRSVATVDEVRSNSSTLTGLCDEIRVGADLGQREVLLAEAGVLHEVRLLQGLKHSRGGGIRSTDGVGEERNAAGSRSTVLETAEVVLLTAQNLIAAEIGTAEPLLE